MYIYLPFFVVLSNFSPLVLLTKKKSPDRRSWQGSSGSIGRSGQERNSVVSFSPLPTHSITAHQPDCRWHWQSGCWSYILSELWRQKLKCIGKSTVNLWSRLRINVTWRKLMTMPTPKVFLERPSLWLFRWRSQVFYLALSPLRTEIHPT